MGFADWFMKLTTGSGLKHKPVEASLECRMHRAASFLTRSKIFLDPNDVKTLLDDLLHIIENDDKFDYVNYMGEAFPNLRSLFLASASVQRNVRRLAEKNGEPLELTMTTKIPQEMQMSPETKEHLTVVTLLEEPLAARLLAGDVNPLKIPFLTNIPHSISKLNELYRSTNVRSRSIIEAASKTQTVDSRKTNQVASLLKQWQTLEELINQLEETQGASPEEITDLRYLQDLNLTHQTALGIQNIIISTLSPES